MGGLIAAELLLGPGSPATAIYQWAGGRAAGLWSDAAVSVPLALPGAAVGAVWLWRRNRAGRGWHDAGLYLVAGTAWLTGCGVALVHAIRAFV